MVYKKTIPPPKKCVRRKTDTRTLKSFLCAPGTSEENFYGKQGYPKKISTENIRYLP